VAPLNLKQYVRERWFDVRNGYALYLSIVLGFVNFVLIVSVKFNSLSLLLLMITLGSVCLLITMAIGYIHRKHQLGTDMDSNYKKGRLAAAINLVMLKAIQGKATPEEIDWATTLLDSVKDDVA
jgi:hypothetical protein